MSKNDTTSQVAGWMIAAVLQQGVMIWAALETGGVLRVALWSLIALGVLGILIRAAQGHAAVLKKSDRPAYGDVHVNIEADSSQFAAGMTRAKGASERLNRRLGGLDGMSR